MKKLLIPLIGMLTFLMIGVCGNATGVCGWNEMFDGKLVTATVVLFDTALAGWFIVFLFLVYQVMLWLKTRNMTLSWITGVFFIALFATAKVMDATGNPVLKPISMQIIFAILVLELAAIVYVWLWK